MHKFFRALNIAVISSIIMSTPVYAGMENHDGILRYFKDDTGTYAVNEWIDLNGSWYNFDKNSNSSSGWVRINRIWYYLDPSTGIMKTGWLLSEDGNWYYLDDESGAMLSKTRTPDGYYVEKNGRYNPDKGNINDDKKGPGANLSEKKLENILKGTTFPDLTEFATVNLSNDTWGVEGSQEAMVALGVNVAEELKEQGIAVTGDTTIYMDGNSITFAIEGTDKPLLKLIKNEDHYELYDYASIDKNMEAPLLAMCSLISSQPQSIYNVLYTAAQYDQTVMSSISYKTFGDSQIKYTIVGNHDYFYFSIKGK